MPRLVKIPPIRFVGTGRASARPIPFAPHIRNFSMASGFFEVLALKSKKDKEKTQRMLVAFARLLTQYFKDFSPKTMWGSIPFGYAEWIAQSLSCEAKEYTEVKISDLESYDTIIYGGGLYAEMIAGVSLITKNMQKLAGKKIIVFTTGLTPIDVRSYYDDLVVKKNFKGDTYEKIKMFNFPGKMILSELTLPHRTAIVALKKLMSGKENPTEMEKLLIELCDADGDFSDRSCISELVAYAMQ